jgi:hypothetical protein
MFALPLLATLIPQFYFHFTSLNVENDTRFLKSTYRSTFVIFNVIVTHLKIKKMII